MFKIEVKSNYKNYPVFIGDGSLEHLKNYIKNADKVLVVTDENVYRLYAKTIIKQLKNVQANIKIMKPGEKSKSISSLTSILDMLQKNNYTKDSLIVAFGGGVVGDIAGFAASIYMRGIDIVQVPTTLLSCVDSSVGGKTGIDFKGIKNLVGSFYNPSAVLIEPAFLNTLPEEEFISGLGEVIKYKFLIGGDFYKSENLNAAWQKETASVIKECISFKSSVTSLDERDNGLRKILNLGHTFGHAYESASNYKLKHGVAVALGLISSLYLSYEYNLISKEQLNDFVMLPYSILGGKLTGKINFDKTMEALKLDKKAIKGKTTFILVKDPGNIITDFVADEKRIIKSIKSTFSL